MAHMKQVPLLASARTEHMTSASRRKAGKVPGVVYGNKVENTVIECDESALKKAFIQAGESTIVELDMSGKKVPVLFHALQFDPVSDRLTHVDFYAVDMNKELETDVHIRLEGEAPAAKDLGAIIITPLDHVLVRCLPADLPHDLPVNIGALTEFGSSITVKDILVPKGVTVLTDPEAVLALAQQPREEEKPEEVAAPAEGAEGAVAATAEGQSAADGAAKPEEAKKEE
jgi:large subunit ribosomal protein L25